MKTAAELKEIAQFIAEYATRLMGSGVHTSRVVRNSKRLGEALGVRVIVSAFQRVVTFSVCDDESGEIYSEVADIPPLPISFELNAELSALSWEAFARRLPTSSPGRASIPSSRLSSWALPTPRSAGCSAATGSP